MPRSFAHGPIALLLALFATASLGADPATLTDEASKTSYALGYQLGRDMAGVDIRSGALEKGLADGRAGTKAQLNADEMGALLASLQKKINEQRQKNQAAELQARPSSPRMRSVRESRPPRAACSTRCSRPARARSPAPMTRSA
jgi:Domain amino terminal to FKBP-type peptidyl-prolyl isomerase